MICYFKKSLYLSASNGVTDTFVRVLYVNNMRETLTWSGSHWTCEEGTSGDASHPIDYVNVINRPFSQDIGYGFITSRVKITEFFRLFIPPLHRGVSLAARRLLFILKNVINPNTYSHAY